MPEMFQEFRRAVRGLSKNPVVAVAALLSLALGIGANTAIFSLADQLLLRSLPVKDPQDLVLFSAPGPRAGFVETNYDDNFAFSYPMFCDFRDRGPGLAGVLARFSMRLRMSWGQQTELVQGDLVSGTYFDVLGVRTVLGRPLNAGDDRLGAPNQVVVISYGLWESRFARAAGILNQSLHLNGVPMTIVGVAAPGFKGVAGSESAEVFVPITLQPRLTQMFDGLRDRQGYWLNILARLKPGVPRAQAESILNSFWQPILEEEGRNNPRASAKFRARMAAQHLSLRPGAPGISAVRDTAEGPLLVLMGMAGLLLLIACANIANLLIARAAARQKEIAVRLAIGAGRGQLFRQLLIEGLTLSLAGAGLGIVTARWTGDVLLGYLPSDPSVSGLSAQLDARVLAFGLGLALFTGVIFALAPVWETLRTNVAASLKDQAAAVMGSAAHVRFRKVLVAGQVALSLVLLTGAGLFARSLYNLKRIDPGFRAQHLISFAVEPSLNGYTQERTFALYERLTEAFSHLPQVRGVAMAEVQLLAGNVDMSGITVPGYEPKEGESTAVRENFIGPGYFSAMGIPLVAGREFTPHDGPAGSRVAVINEQMARKYFRGENALGRHFTFASPKKGGAGIEIVGVVRDGKHADLREKSEPFAYFPYVQHRSLMRMNFYVRSSQDAAAIGAVLRNEVRREDANLPVFDMKTIEQQIDENVFTERLVAVLSAFFGAVATLLAAIGLYGVMAYTVSRRTREIGLRMALGAGRAGVLRMVMREVGLLTVIGIAVALPAGLAATRVIQSQLYNVRAHDPAVFLGAAAAIALVAVIAGLIPAVAATRIDPITALRNE